MFGVGVRDGRHAQRGRGGGAAAEIDRALGAGEVALMVGESGAGKSTIGRALARRAGAVMVGGRGVRSRRAADASSNGRTARGTRHEARGGERVIDLFEAGLDGAMAYLAQAGLGEARVMMGRADRLSEGQRARLAIALAMERVAKGRMANRSGAPMLIIDEFASNLDRVTAMGLSRTVARWARGAGVRLVCITAHEDVLEWLGPEVLVVVGRHGVGVRRRGVMK